MKTKKLNVEQICSIKICLDMYNSNYEYKKAIKLFSFTLRKEGFYWKNIIGSDELKTVEEIEESGKYICKDKRVCFKPHLEIRTSDGRIHEVFFESENQLHNYMNGYGLVRLRLIEA